jgi:hypothetical protein
MVNAYTQDRFGCRPTMMFFMGWMMVMIFIPVFAPSLSILAWGEAMCGVSWGVFQVSFGVSLIPKNVFGLTKFDPLDPFHNVCMRSRSHRSPTICHRLCVHVLGCGYPPLIRCCASRGKRRRRPRLETSICAAMDLANSPYDRGVFRPRVAVECGPQEPIRCREEESNPPASRYAREGA